MMPRPGLAAGRSSVIEPGNLTRRAGPLFLVAAILAGAQHPAVETTAAGGDAALALSCDPSCQLWPGLVTHLTPEDGAFTVQTNFQNGASVGFQGADPGDFWRLDFAAPERAPLMPGKYAGATHFPFQATDRPGLSVAGQGLSCESMGTFEILELVQGSDGSILAFHARFEHHCARLEGTLVGEVQFGTSSPVLLIGPLAPAVEKTRTLDFDVRAFSPDPGTIDLLATTLPEGASFDDEAAGRGTFSWTPGFGQTGTHLARFSALRANGDTAELATTIDVTGINGLWIESAPGDPVGLGQWLFATSKTGSFTNPDAGESARFVYREDAWIIDLVFAAPDGAPLAPGMYEGAMLHPFQDADRPGLRVAVFPGGSCYPADGRFTVREIRRNLQKEIVAFWATFEQSCAGAPGGLRGEVRYRANVSVLARAPERRVVPAREPMSLGVQGFSEAGGPPALTTENPPEGARFTDHGDGTAALAWNPGALDAGRYRMTFRATDGEGRTDFAWTDLEVRLANDDVDGALVILELPFRDQATTLTATRSIDDPSCDTYDATVWYALTPRTDLVLRATTAGSDYATSLSAYTGARPFMKPLVCSFGDLILEAQAGATYYLMVNGREGGGRLEFAIVGYPPLELDLLLDHEAQLAPRTGTITAGGTLTCTRPAPVTLHVTLAPATGRSPGATQTASLEVDCDGVTEWSAQFPAGDRRVPPNSASLEAAAAASDDLLQRMVSAHAEDEIQIGVKPPRSRRGGP